MTQQVNAIGDACPLPVVKTKKALKEMAEGTLEVLVDNQIAVQNLERLAKASACAFSFVQDAQDHFTVTLVKQAGGDEAQDAAACACGGGSTVVAVGSNHMGDGDEALGKILIKGFFFALTQLEMLPEAILFYNSGAYLTTEGSESLKDIEALSNAGVEILTCGTCLKHYGLEDKLKVGGATNMYAIVEKQMQAGRILRP
ncbi:MAG: sulfurtransferase-like selenium metabolism protein YedF [Clostridia bacterium]|nr:sulfurtransferase-like selenium metabolism protein YedF [Clostridia bacterium]